MDPPPRKDLSRRSNNVAAQSGIALPVFSLLLAIAVIMAMLLVGVANRAGERARAQAAADAVALAGAAEGRDAAEIIAGANGATLERFEVDGNGVTVAVMLDGVRAIAAAEKQIRPSP